MTAELERAVPGHGNVAGGASTVNRREYWPPCFAFAG